MAYATQADAELLYGSDYVTVAFDRDGDGVIDSGLPELLFDIATAEINSFLAGRVPLPLSTVPSDVMMRCVDIAIYRACPSAAELTEEKTTRFKAAHDWLKMVAANEIKLTDDGDSLGTHLTQRARIITGANSYYEQDEGSRYFSREIRKRDGLL
jgi:phage gp36-like protein